MCLVNSVLKVALKARLWGSSMWWDILCVNCNVWGLFAEGVDRVTHNEMRLFLSYYASMIFYKGMI